MTDVARPSNEKVARLRAVFDDRSKEFRRSHAEALFNEFANLERRLDAREELIDGYEKQLGIAEADATITIGSEIARLLEIEKRATAEPCPGCAEFVRMQHDIASLLGVDADTDSIDLHGRIYGAVSSSQPAAEPVACRKLIDSPYDPEPRYTYRDGTIAGWEPLYAAPSASALPPAPTLPEYTHEIGEAGEQYLKSVSLDGQYYLSGTFRWHELWEAMGKAAGLSSSETKPGEQA